MKNIKYLWLLSPLVIVFPFLLIAAEGELEEWETILIGLVVIAVAQIVRWVVQLIKKEKIHKRWAYIIALLTSIVLAVFLKMPALPPFPGWEGFFAWLGDIVGAIDGVLFWAVFIYNIVLPELLDKLGDIIEKRLKLRVRG